MAGPAGIIALGLSACGYPLTQFAGLSSGRRAGPGTPGQLARRLRLALEEAGPIFVKAGQVASTRTALLPAQVTTELAKLQDHVPAAPRAPLCMADPGTDVPNAWANRPGASLAASSPGRCVGAVVGLAVESMSAIGSCGGPFGSAHDPPGQSWWKAGTG